MVQYQMVLFGYCEVEKLGNIKRYSGGRWVDFNDIRKQTNGNLNSKAVVRRMTGGQWQVISEERRVDVWNATWSDSYSQDGNIEPDYKVGSRGRMYQGRYGNPDSYWYGNPWGRQRSLMGFSNSIQGALSGAKIEKVELYLHIGWAWYWAGAVATIGVHNFTSKPSRFNHVRYGIKEVRYSSREQGMWITLDNSVGSWFADGSVRGFTLLKESDDPLYYGHWYGTDGGGEKCPKLRVTYYK